MMVTCAQCGGDVPAKREAYSHRELVFCCREHRVGFHNEKARAKRRAIWQAAPLKICVECHQTFRPPFISGWQRRKRCPGCRLPAYEAQRRHRDRVKHERKARHWPDRAGKQWPCQDCGKMSDNRLHCPDCKARRLAGGGMDEYQLVETVDPMGYLW